MANIFQEIVDDQMELLETSSQWIGEHCRKELEDQDRLIHQAGNALMSIGQDAIDEASRIDDAIVSFLSRICRSLKG